MPRIMPMPPESELPDGPHRDCAGELRRCCRAAGCAALRQVSRAIESREDLRASQSGASARTRAGAAGRGLAAGAGHRGPPRGGACAGHRGRGG